MSNGSNISGTAIAGILAGGVLIYAAVKNVRVSDTIRSLVGGKPPPAGSVDIPAAGTTGGGSAPASSGGNYRALGKFLATPYGWAIGAEWQALDNLLTRESGWQNNIMNPSSHAFGIGQALGHGTSNSAAGNVLVKYPDGSTQRMTVNEYPTVLANSGDPNAQIFWTYDYIHGRYGDPITAWAHEQANNWY